MTLIECYIENFGKLQQFTYKFQDGLNTINELNGWGKSTFAAFIRAMFYGMDASRTKKNLDEAERKKYTPWQGGRFGGYIIFELDGKEYKIERFFGEKIKDDTFILYNQKTGLESKNFSSNIGEEIFKLDRAAYSRSTYIPQNSIAIEANDSINAKLSNLIENDNSNDINNYDSAMKLLDKSKKEYVKTGSRGKLDIIRNKIASMEIALEKCMATGTDMEKWNERLDDIILNKNVVKEKLKNVKSQVEATSKYEAQTIKLQQYNELCDVFKRLQADFDPLLKFFGENVPTEAEIEKCDIISSNLLKVQGELKSYELTEREKFEKDSLNSYFAHGVPDLPDIDECDELITKYRENKIKLDANELTELEKQKKSKFKKFFEKGVPSEVEIDAFVNKIPQLNELNSNITTEKSKLYMLKNIGMQNAAPQNNNAQSNKEKTNNTSFVVGIVTVIIGIILAVILLPLGIACILGGIAICVISKITHKNQQDQKVSNAKESTDKSADKPQDSNLKIQMFIDNLISQKDLMEEEFNTFIEQFGLDADSANYYSSLNVIKANSSEYRNLLAKFENKENTVIKIDQAKIITKINSYVEKYCDDLSITIEQKYAIWKNVKNRRTQHLTICNKLSKYEEIKSKYADLKDQLFRLLNAYFDEIDTNPITNVNVLREKRKEYERLARELTECRNRKGQFEKDNDIELFKNIQVPEYNLKELQESEKALDSGLEHINSEESNARMQIRDLSDEADRCPDLQNDIEQLSNDLKAGEERLEILNKTILCLEDAKDNFATRYLDNMNQGFERYINMLDNGFLGVIHMDVQLNVNVSAYGSQRSLDYFSTGYRDLIGIATRFSLVDALFENEKPFIILDDPFTNLDGEKLNKALRMIGEISKKYQIIYFVCHESRTGNS